MFQSPPKPERKYVIGGRYGKVKGFNFYLQDGEKLKPFQRRKLLNESEDLISQIVNEEVQKFKSIEKIDKDLTPLDPDLTDIELLEIWNVIYDKYGSRMYPFKNKWEREFIGSEMEFGNKEDESKSYNPLKIDWMDKMKVITKTFDIG